MRRHEHINPIFFILCVVFIVVAFFYFDQNIAYFFHQLDYKKNLPFMSWITMIGSGPVQLLVLFSWAIGVNWFKPESLWQERSWFLFFCVLIPNLICLALKMLVGRARPDLLFLDNIYGFYGVHLTQAKYWSFPSGHTTGIVSLFYGMHWIFPDYTRLWILLGVLFIATRVLLDQHYLSDVVATACLTLLELFIMMRVMRHQGWFQFKAYQKAA